VPKLTKSAPKKAKAARMETEMHKYKTGEMHSGSKHGPKVNSRKQAVAIALSESGQSRRSASKSKKAASKKDGGDTHLLERYKHHKEQADKHRAHADVIEAKLRTQGKEIRHQYPGESVPVARESKPIIVKVK
jgi:hypothetical protein